MRSLDISIFTKSFTIDKYTYIEYDITTLYSCDLLYSLFINFDLMKFAVYKGW